MALMIWLPFTDINHCLNLGLLGPVTQVTAPTLVDGGKLGKCLSTGCYSLTSELTNECLNNKEFSFSCWIYPNKSTGTSTSNNYNQYKLFNGGTDSLRRYAIFMYPDVNSLHISWRSGSTTNFSIIKNNVFPSNLWTHLTITYNNPKLVIYINGTKLEEYEGIINNSDYNIASDLMSSNNYRYINDYRIYNHCLSPKEVKEISKGLVLHYPLNWNGLVKTNLIKNMGNASFGFNDYTSKATVSKEDSDGNTYTKIYKLSFPEDTATYSNYNTYISFTRDTEVAVLKDEKTYTLSFKVKASKPLNSYLFNYEYISTSKSINVTTEWLLVFITGKAVGTYSALYVCMGQANRNKINGGNLYIADLKLEEGDTYTQWSPHINDSDYTKYNPNTFIVYDCSGYENNGTITGTLTTNTDTPRYEKCTYVNNSTISHISCVPKSNQTWSVSAWIKPDGNIVSGSKLNNLARGCYLNYGSLNKTLLYINEGPAYYVYGTENKLKSNEWQHITFVFDHPNRTCKTYINGILDKTSTASAGLEYSISDTTILFLNFKGYVSDYREYATALSDNDVKELYNTSAFITDNGSLECYLFEEEGSNPLIEKSGEILCNFYSENTTIPLKTVKTTSFTPTANTNNSCASFCEVYTKYFNSYTTYIVEYDVEWSGLSAGTGGTYNVGIGWSCVIDSSNTWNWSIQGITGNAGSLPKTESSGNKHVKVSFKPTATALTYNRYLFGTRIDYAQAGGSIVFKNIKIYPRGAEDSITKFGQDYITSNQLIEI